MQISKKIRSHVVLLATILILMAWQAVPVDAQPAPVVQNFNGKVRIKELATLEGLDSVTVAAPGLVVGLNATGDSVSRLSELLARYDITLPGELAPGGMAIVMVSATIKPFMSFGDRVSAEISILGDATSLENGRLLSTQLLSPLQSGVAEKDIYMLAEGPIALADDQNSPVNGHVHLGGTVVRDLRTQFHHMDHFILVLRDADFKTADNIISTLNDEAPRLYAEQSGGEVFGSEAFQEHAIAEPIDAKRIKVKIPKKHRNNIVSFISRVQDIEVDADLVGTVTINLKTKLVSFSGNVVVMPTTIMYKNVIINTGNTPPVNPNVGEVGKINVIKPQPTSLRNVTNDLMVNGWTNEDMIAIVMELHRIGAIKAKLVVN